MSDDLRSVNFEKCKSIIKEFMDGLARVELDQELKEKKMKAEAALDQLDRVFNPELLEPEGVEPALEDSEIQAQESTCAACSHTTP
jgi:hypothetical protein